MTKKVLITALFVVLAFALIWAGAPTQKGMTTTNPQMEMMKTEMMKCAVCKNMAMHMDEIGPMGMEAVKLNDGSAITHWVKSTDPKKIAAFHTACTATSTAGEACMQMTDEQAKTDLCQFCQGMRTAMKAGAHMSQGETKKGSMMVLTSSDPAVLAQITTLHEMCAAWAAQMDMPTSKVMSEKK